ncbi:MAG TPA: NAD(+)/NADH kinase, partial [Chitinophagaceae bacterium]|nr:NAD(+)/NADH kinase [Chitinophagaceae bacterium]
MKAAIYSRVMVDEQRNDIQSFFDELGHQQIIPVIHQHFFEEIKNIINLPADATTFTGADDLTDEVEFIISLGGDGTLLDTITLVRDKDIAIMGINFGRMGFLASIGRDELRVAVKAMVQRTYVVD